MLIRHFAVVYQVFTILLYQKNILPLPTVTNQKYVNMEHKNLWKQNRELKKQVSGIKEIRDRMWDFIVASGLEDRYDAFCEFGETDDVESKYISRCLFIELSGLSDEFQSFQRTKGAAVVNYKGIASSIQKSYDQLMEAYLAQANYITKLQDKIITMIENKML